MLFAVGFISCSSIFEDESLKEKIVSPLPSFIPIVLSFSMPLVCSSFAMFQKYVFETKKIAASDYTFGYFLIRQAIFFLISLWYFQNNKLDWGLYSYGFFGSIIDVLGCYFANCAIATRSPVGPIFALTDT
jgi:hypothetical protein